MPLRRLELSNFKSYRGTQVIDFGVAPFTCIIGPNGSGKSNLMDAISFVLGVKSAQLRSTQLRDLVYRGRKAAEGANEMGLDVPVPETQEESLNGSNDARTASVMAVYADEAGEEWTFKRTISMAGASTYYLNGKVVQWSAYNQQLEKFNILVKAKNFLVFQGDVEGVASQDSKALAKLIDRISGSSELAPAYDAANLAQSKAAEVANSNSAAKRSMLTEAKHFKEQTVQVKQWEKLLAAKDAMQHRHLLWKLYHLTKEINESTRQVESATEELSDLRNAVDNGEGELKDARSDYATTHLKVKSRESAVKKADRAVDDKKPELVAVETQILHSEKKVKNTVILHERVQKDHARQAESLAKLKAGAETLKQQMEKAKQRQLEKSQAAGKALSNADLGEYRKLRSDANLLAVSERQQLESLRREQKVLRDALVSIDDRLQQAESKRSKLSQDVEGLADRDEAMSAKVKDMDGERQRIKAQIDHAQEERTRISLRETELEDRLQETLQKLLQAGVDKRESEREVKMRETLSSLRRVIPGVHGRMCELVKPTASKYADAVDIVLGRNRDAVIVDKESTAISCIEYMRQQRAGQATFIPIETIQIKPVPEKLRNFARGARLAIDCIEFDASLERAVQHACGSAMICDTIEVAKYICYEKRQEVKAVTLEGTVIHKSGLITGGSSGKKNSHKFSDRDVTTLKESKDNYLLKLQELKKSKPNPKDDEALIQSLARLEAEATTASDDLNATRLRLGGLRKELAAVEKDIKKMTPDREQRAKELAASEGKGKALAKTVDAADDEVFASFCKRINVDSIREYEDGQLKLAREEEEALQAFTAQSARASHQIKFEEAQLQSTEERLALLESSLKTDRRTAARLVESKAEIEKQIEELQRDVETQRGKLEKANAVLERCAEQVEASRDAQRKAQRRLDRALKEISGWNDEIERSDSDRRVIYRKCRLEDIDLPLVSGSLSKVPIDEAVDDAMDVDENSLVPKQATDYGIEPDFRSLDDDDKENDGEEHGRELESQIEKLKGDADRLVPNMRAVDRLADVQAALETAEDEAEAARQASKTAREEFLRLKKKRCELFNKAFKHMTGCIDKIYKDLTKNSVVPTGGMAFLSLENNEEPYLGGVKYNAMPPGKRFVEIEQLSGGEKTMAALALLFSIHSFHPAPFFVLDEVDAALDPTNVSKLARYVREQAEKHVQFLIISLKSTLYEHADSLVGVYREQVENSSQTLSLDLREYE